MKQKLDISNSELHNVRTRFPPSPTGALQMGNVRTALFNYLFAKAQKGDFVLRIEDTDKERSKREWEEEIIDGLHWLGIDWDEGPAFALATAGKPEKDIGPYAPYRQSERTELYKKYLQGLLEQGKAYYCFCSHEELDAQRQHQTSLGEAPRYIGTCRNLSKQQVQNKIQEDMPSVIRFVIEAKIVVFNDLVRDEIKFDTSLLGDIIIAKDLDTPLYNFTVVIDDFEMQITHVIRGEDHIANTPKQILIQEALDLPGVQYAHVPLLLGEDRTKLSKRHGDTSVKKFREDGYLPEAIINFLVLLGWNPGNDREIFSLQELIKEFTFERVQKGAAVFSVQRLDWINGSYIRKKPLNELTVLCLPYLVEAGFIVPLWETKETVPNLTGYLGKQLVQTRFRIHETDEEINFSTLQIIISLYQERLKKLSEITELTDFFFQKQLEYSKELLQWKDANDEQTKSTLEILENLVAGIGEGEWNKEKLEHTIMPEAEKARNRGYLLWPFRVALTGKKASAGPFEVAAVLGYKKVLLRIQEAKNKV